MTSFINQIFQKFKAASGHHILIATICSRAFSFIASWWAYRQVGTEALAPAIYAFQIIAFLVPFMGMGLYHGTLKYGAELSSKEDKIALYTAVLHKGRKWSLATMLLLITLGSIWDMGFEDSGQYLIVFSLMLYISFEYEMQKVLFRLLHHNDKFALFEGLHWFLLLIFVVGLTPWLGALGYALAFIFAPLTTVLYGYLAYPQLFKSHIRPISSTNSINKAFFSYGLHTAFANVISKLLFAVDILLIGWLVSREDAVTIYKYLTLLPFSILFLSGAYMTTHFVTLSKAHKDRSYTRKFIQEYILIFSGISFIYLLFCRLFAVPLLRFFGPELVPYTDVFMILALGTTGILILRGLFGNLLSACGRADLAFYAGAIGLGVNIASNFVLIPKYGLLGAAVTSASIMWLTGLLSSMFYFVSCTNKYK